MRHGADVFIAAAVGLRRALGPARRRQAASRTRRSADAGARRACITRRCATGSTARSSIPRERAPCAPRSSSAAPSGGLSTAGEAALLASHGYPALALAYFREPGLPATLKDIPLEYFARALRRLRARPDVDPRRVAVIGVSRGGEGALLIGVTYPRLVHGVVALVPSDVVQPSPDRHSAAWTLHGRPLAHVAAADFRNPDPSDEPEAVIRAERIAGPILTVSGGDDALWPSSAFATGCISASPRATSPTPIRTCSSPTRGTWWRSALPVPAGGSGPRVRGLAARRRGGAGPPLWPRILEFMRRLGGD